MTEHKMRAKCGASKFDEIKNITESRDQASRDLIRPSLKVPLNESGARTSLTSYEDEDFLHRCAGSMIVS